MRRAFLCHSSQDKEYVRVLASKLTRAKVIFDELAFQPGQDFRDEIRRHLSNTALFVFVASRPALESGWCRFELDEAELRAMSGGIQGQLTLIIDHDVAYSDLPAWLGRTRALIQTRPSQAARDVEHALLALVPADERRPLVGRENELKAFLSLLYPIGRPVPHLLTVHGLPGVGRRSLLERAVFDNLDMTLGPFFEVDEAQRLEDFYLFLLDETGDVSTRRRMAEELDRFRGLDAALKTKEIELRLALLVDARTIPCLVDSGGLLDTNATFADGWREVITTFVAAGSDRYLATVHRRRPIVADEFDDHTLSLRVPPLPEEGTAALLRQLLRRSNVTPSEQDVLELVEYLDGYPPAVYAATTLCDRYGIDVLLADKRELVDFKTRAFQRFLTELDLSDRQWLVLRYLAGEGAMPFTTLAVALEIPDDDLAEDVRNLVDLSLVQTRDRALSIADPIRDALFKVKGFLGASTYRDIGRRLAEAFWTETSSAPPLGVIDATLHALSLSGSEVPREVTPLIRSSTLERAASELYDRGDFTAALDYGLRGASLPDGDSRRLREIRYKSYVRLERWAEADVELATIGAKGDRQYYFLKGFGQRRRGQLIPAIAAFRSAIEALDRRASVYRELAFCYYAMGRFHDALEQCRAALGRDANNPYVWELMVNVELGLGDFVAAEAALRELERVDVSLRFVHHRRASYWLRRRDYDAALREITLAIDSGFAVVDAMTLRVSILIEADMFDQAAVAISEMLERFPGQRHDVITGLQCKSLARQGKWREAQVVWDRLRQRDLPVHQGLLKSILMQKADDPNVPGPERDAAREQADLIAADLVQLADLQAAAIDDE